MAEKNNKQILEAVLGVEKEQDVNVYMKRFGFDFVIRALENEEVEQAREQASKPGHKGAVKIDENLFNYLLISKSCVTPNWNDEAIVEKLGVMEGWEAVRKQLKFGEVMTLVQEIQEINGLNDDEDEIEQLKK